MKKYIGALALAISLSACANDNNLNQETNQTSQTETNETRENENRETQVIEIKAGDQNAPAKNDTEIKPREEEDQKEDLDELEDDSKEEESNEVEDNVEEDDREEENNSNQSSMVGDNFFLPYSYIVKLTEDGGIVNYLDEAQPTDESAFFTYVKYTNNMFVKEEPTSSKFSIVRMDDNDIVSLYEFNENEEFRPLGLVDNKVYGFHSYYKIDEATGNKQFDSEKSAIGAYDLNSGEVHDFEDTKGANTGDAVVAGNSLQFSKAGDDYPENAYSYDLYELDLSKGYDQEAELIQKDFDLHYLFGQKDFVDGKAAWNIWTADNDNIYVDGKKFPFLWAEEGFQDFIGNNLFSFKTGVNEENYSEDPYLVHMTVTDVGTGEDILDTNVRGIKIIDGKLYYINEDKQIESIDIDL